MQVFFVNRHRLLYHHASMPRIVPLVSNRRVCEVSNNADVSQRKVIQIVREVLGDDLLEPRGKYFIFAQPNAL